LQAGAPAVAARIDWQDLEAAPGWLALPEPDLSRFAMRVGAFACAPSLRMWIDASRLAAAKAAIGPRFLQALLALPEALVTLPRSLRPALELASADRVAAELRASGLGVLAASLPPGILRDAAIALHEPVTPAPMPDEVARRLLTRVQSLILADRSTPPAGANAPGANAPGAERRAEGGEKS
jgi:hypothetical protein